MIIKVMSRKYPEIVVCYQIIYCRDKVYFKRCRI